jgi:hypothetical protein|tara:strand:- start:1935 stop:2351 length:417 start_codon:yes stop_codon:yes gene_type:complete
MAVSVDKLVKIYVKIRDKRDILRKAYQNEDGELIEHMDKIKDALHDHLKKTKTETARTLEGTFYRTKKTRYWTSDWVSMWAFMREHDVPEFCEKKLSQKAVAQFLEENPEDTPPGLNANTEYTISVRAPKKNTEEEND